MCHIYTVYHTGTHTHTCTHTLSLSLSLSHTHTYIHTHTHTHTHTHMSHHDPLHIQMSHVTHMNQACLAIWRIISYTKMSHVSGMSRVHMCLSQYGIHVKPPLIFTNVLIIVWSHSLLEYDIFIFSYLYIYIYITPLFAWIFDIHICIYACIHHNQMYISLYTALNSNCTTICVNIVHMYMHTYIYMYNIRMCVSKNNNKIKPLHYVRKCFHMVCLESQRLYHRHTCAPPHSLHRLYLPILLPPSNVCACKITCMHTRTNDVILIWRLYFPRVEPGISLSLVEVLAN